jgi:NhaA family Na+:H+ antiporter
MTTRPPAPLFATVLDPVRAFLRLEAASGILLLAAAAIALAWANSPWRGVYAALLSLPFTVGAGGVAAHFTLAALINDGLMSLFFFVVGMEVKRELVVGQLNTVRRAVLPGLAALGGMLAPAGVYLLVNRGGEGAAGWAIPMATDIAFCIGALTLLNGRVPIGLVVFVTALAIFDDMGGILVIALFYGEHLALGWLLAAAVAAGGLFLMGRRGVRSGYLYAAGGLLLWNLVHLAGIHATIAGVVLGFAIPARSRRPVSDVLEGLREHVGEVLARGVPEVHPGELHRIEERLGELDSPLNRFVHALHPWVAFVVMPVFALANSGVDLSTTTLATLTGPVVVGTVLGLVVGKQVGIFVFTWAAVRSGAGSAPGGATFLQIYGVSVLGGIGFTVALFIAELAFGGRPQLLDQARLGILIGSLVSGAAGYLVLRLAPRGVAAPS